MEPRTKAGSEDPEFEDPGPCSPALDSDGPGWWSLFVLVFGGAVATRRKCPPTALSGGWGARGALRGVWVNDRHG